MINRLLPLKTFFILGAALFAGTQVNAQLVTACNDPAGGIQIHFDNSQNCAAAPGSLAGLNEIGFHSGANGWMNVVDWNAGTATTGVNDGNDVFVVTLADPNAYYGLTATEINFVFNQGPETPGSPWDSEGKADDGAGGCADLSLNLATVTETCATTSSTKDLLPQDFVTIAPNPFSDVTRISFDNATQENYTIRVYNALGQTVRNQSEFRGETFEFRKGQLSAGLYFLVLTNEAGQFVTKELMVK